MGIAYFGLVVTLVGLYVVFGRTVRADALRAAERKAEIVSTYERCVASIPELRKISTHVTGVNDAFAVLLHNSANILAATPRDDPQYRVRSQNYVRLKDAYKKVATVSSFPVPTRAECERRQSDAQVGSR